MSHGLRPDFRLSGQGLAEHSKSASRIFTNIIRKARIYGQTVAIFKRRHSVGIEAVAAANKVLGCFNVGAALMGNAGIVNVFENTVFYKNIVAHVPELNAVAKAYTKLLAPNTTADTPESAAAHRYADT